MEKTNNFCEIARNNGCDICFQMQKNGIRKACVKLNNLINCESFGFVYNFEPSMAILKAIKNSIEVYDCLATKKLADRVEYTISNVKGEQNTDLTSSDCSIIEMLLEELNVFVSWRDALIKY